MKIYEFTDHRLFIREKILDQKKVYPDLTHGKVAEAAGITSSFLSQVLGAQQEFSNDQLYAIGLFLGLQSEELDYLLLLNEYHRSALGNRKEDLLKQVEAAQHLHLRLVEYLSFDRLDYQRSAMDDMLCDPVATLMECHFMVESNLKNPELVRKKLDVSPELFEKSLDRLIQAKIVTPKGQGLERLNGEILIYKINAAAKYNAIYSRLKAVDKAFEEDPTDLISTLMFTANDEFIQKVKAELLAFQNSAVERFSNTDADEVLFMNIDLFAVE